MSIKTRFSPLGYLYPKNPKVKLTIVCNIVCDNIYLNGVSVAQNVSQIENLEVNKGLICNIKFEASGYDTLILAQQIVYEDTTIEGYIGTIDTLILNINSGDEGEFYIPLNHFRQVNYNWNIKWGDGTPTQNVSGIYSSSNTGILHKYPNKNTNYTINITSNSNSNAWLLAFGFDETTTNYGPHSLINKNKVLIVDGELTENMFYDIMRPAGRTPVDMSQQNYKFAYMFNDCRNLQFGDSFTMPIHDNIAQVGYAYCTCMFQNCISLTSLKNFQFDGHHLDSLDPDNSEGYCAHMFAGCINLVDLGNFSIGTYINDEDEEMYQGPQNFSVAAFTGMFQNCQSLQSLQNFILCDPISTTIIELKPMTFSLMFFNCKLLNDLSNFAFPKGIIKASYQAVGYQMFYGCISLITIPSTIKIPNVNELYRNTLWYRNGEPYKHGYFESAFENCTSLSTGFITFLSNWTNATQDLIDTHRNEYTLEYYVLFKTFKNCSNIQEILTTSIKPLSFTPNHKRFTFQNCPLEYVNQLNANWYSN